MSSAFTPSGMVKLRMSVTGKDKAYLDQIIEKKTGELRSLAGEYIYGFEVYGEESETLEQKVGRL